MENFGTESFSQKLDQILHLAEENNRMLRAQRRDRLFGFLSKIALWVVILIASYYFTMQYIAPILNSVQQIQKVTAGFTGTKSTASTATTTSIPSTAELQKLMDLYKQYSGAGSQ